MSPTPIVVVGGGEHARVVVDAILTRPARWELLGFLDPKGDNAAMNALGARCLGGDEAAVALRERAEFILGVGSLRVSDVRRRIAERYDAMGVSWANVVHATAIVSPSATLGLGVAILGGAVVNTGARLGNQSVVNTRAVVEHDVEVGAFAQIGPGAVLGGAASVGEGSFLGLGCLIRDHTKVGRGALVGMGAAVLKDVPDGTTVLGAKPGRRLAPGEAP